MLKNNDSETTKTGRILENHTPNGSDAMAAVTHQTPWRRPASNGEMSRSSRIKGRKRPKVYEIKITLLPCARKSNNTAQPRKLVVPNSLLTISTSGQENSAMRRVCASMIPW